MSIVTLLLLAVGLSMDAFAVSVCKGLAMGPVRWGRACVLGLWFGGFQGLMPLLGWLLGSRFAGYITAVDHWIAFGLLLFLGLKMLRETGETQTSASLAAGEMLALAVATSIDALAVGITFAFLEVEVLPAVGLIAAVTFLLSTAGGKAGGRIGARHRSMAQALGGWILILLGCRLLLEGLELL